MLLRQFSWKKEVLQSPEPVLVELEQPLAQPATMWGPAMRRPVAV
ncbi:MAG: hypothetical protein WD229_14060 [Pirellulales bacterium]